MPQTEDAIFYQLYFQEPGVAEAEYDRHVRRFSTPARLRSRATRQPSRDRSAWCRGRAVRFVGTPSRRRLPAWLSEADIDFFAAEFTRTGFRGGLNWYRNIDRNWELLAPFDGLPVTVPALYMAGDRDPVVKFPGMDRHIADLAKFAPRLRANMMLPGCGHLIQRERPHEVNAAMIDFLRSL